MIDWLKSVHPAAWLGVVLALAAAVGGVYWAGTAPVDAWAAEDIAGPVTLAQRIVAGVIWVVAGGGVAALILVLGRRK